MESDAHENIIILRRVVRAMPAGEKREEANRALQDISFDPERHKLFPPEPPEPIPGNLSGGLGPCEVCELGISGMPEVSERQWAFIPTARELLYICLSCGNTHRSRRLE